MQEQRNGCCTAMPIGRRLPRLADSGLKEVQASQIVYAKVQTGVDTMRLARWVPMPLRPVTGPCAASIR